VIRIRIECEPDCDAWREWREACEKEEGKALAAAQREEPPEINERLYKKDKIRKGFFFKKSGPFRGKCAYCESYITDGRDGDIDHYRPKGRVTDEDDREVKVRSKSGTEVSHPGYYWRAYDWRNLLPACKFCNQPSVVNGKKIGKHDRFPVRGSHASCPEEESGEEPLLLHPAEDNPEDHLLVDSGTGVITGLDDRGRMTVQILGLNVRDRLPEARCKAVTEVMTLLHRILYDEDQAKWEKAAEAVREIWEGRREYALAARQYLRPRVPYLQSLRIADGEAESGT